MRAQHAVFMGRQYIRGFSSDAGPGQVGTQLGPEQAERYRAGFEAPSTAGHHVGLGRCKGWAALARRAHWNTYI